MEVDKSVTKLNNFGAKAMDKLAGLAKVETLSSFGERIEKGGETQSFADFHKW